MDDRTDGRYRIDISRFNGQTIGWILILWCPYSFSREGGAKCSMNLSHQMHSELNFI